MKKLIRSLTCLLLLLLMTSIFVSAQSWQYNPFTRKLDYYEAGLPTGVGIAAGDILFHNGAIWTNLTAGANGLVLTLNAGLPTWMAAGAGDMLRATYDVDLDGDIDTAAGGLEVDSSSWTDYVYVTAWIWAVDPVMGKLPNGISITANADVATHQLAGADYEINWSDGALKLITDEGANTDGVVYVYGKGSGIGAIYTYDTDDDNTVGFNWDGGDDEPNLYASVDLNVMYGADASVDFFTGAGAGENPSTNIWGYITAGTAARMGFLQIDDATDEFLVGVENNANIEGVTIELAEANQRFRIRQNADYFSIGLDGADTTFYNSDGIFIFDTGEAAAVAALVLYDDDTNHVTVQSQEMAADWIFTFPADDGYNLEVLQTDGAGVTSWVAAGTGDVVGPAGATDHAVARYDLATGKLLQDSTGVTIDDNNYLTATRVQIESSSYVLLQTGNRMRISGEDGIELRHTTDIAAEFAFKFYGDADDELNDANGEQAFMLYEPNINQSSTATWHGWHMNVDIVAEGDGSTSTVGENTLVNLEANDSPVWNICIEKVVKAHDADLFDADAVTDTSDIFILPANSILMSCVMVLNTQFAGIDDLKVEVGVTGIDTDGFLLPGAMDLVGDAADSRYSNHGSYWDNAAGTGGFYYVDTATTITALATTTDADGLDETSAGQVTFYFTYFTLPTTT